jgi:hypothetical protein
MNAKIGLAVAVQIQPAQLDGFRHRLLEDSGIYGRTLVNHQLRTREV